MNRLGRNFRRRKKEPSNQPVFWFDFAHDSVQKKGTGSLAVTRALATRTAWCFAESDNAGALLQPIVIPANTARYFGKRWIASNSTWSDKYANGTAIEESFLRGIYPETASMNLLLNSAVVETQNITTTAQTYTLSAWGSGTVTLSGTATGILTTTGLLHDDRAVLTVTATAGNLTLTVSGSVVLGQFEAKPMATSYIPTTGTAVTGNADELTFPNAGNVSDTAGTVLMDVTPAFNIPNSVTAGYGANYIIDFGTDNGVVAMVLNTFRRSDGTTTIASPAWTPLKNTTYKIGSRWGSAGQRNWLNGTAGTNGAFDGSINSGTNMKIGGYGGNTTHNWGGNIKNVKVWKRQLTEAKLAYLTTP